jgi:hypothetical protein
MVPGAGLEPARCCHRGILSPLRLPISPPGHVNKVGLQICAIAHAAWRAGGSIHDQHPLWERLRACYLDFFAIALG